MKKFFLILITILASTLYAKEVDLNTTDFLGIKYGSTKEEVQKQLKSMNLDYKIVKEDRIEINSFNLELCETRINNIYLSFFNDKFISTNFVFDNLDTMYAQYIEFQTLTKIPTLNLESVKALAKNNIVLSYESEDPKLLVNFGFHNTENYVCENFIIGFTSLAFTKK